MSARKLNHQEKVERRRQFYRSFEAQALRQRSFFMRFADDLTNAFSSVTFLFVNAIWFAVWIGMNVGMIPGVEPFDPFPFGLLTMIVSLEAIILAIIILVSQGRQSYVTSVREELHMQVNLIAEEEITKALKLLAEIRVKMGIRENDPELAEMLERINTSYIERSLVNQIEKANAPFAKKVAAKMRLEFPDLFSFKSTKKNDKP
ncbi:DUF1003 domain-containing protein [Candidatus Microgenomates bacterium]|nr:DUF1003 domain-containing protein [Candidatus Microgenomates bacterium]